MPRFFVEIPALRAEDEIDLPAAAARHVQVLRAQPGDTLHLFNGTGGDWQAKVLAMTRTGVTVRIGRQESEASGAELLKPITIATCMPTNDRMDGLVEKATELGATTIRPLMSERSVLRLQGDRASKRVAHWQDVAVSASEQSGRPRVPHVEAVQELRRWLLSLAPTSTGNQVAGRLLLSLREGPLLWELPRQVQDADHVVVLSGPEGGLSTEEEAEARRHGFVPVRLGSRVLRADTAPLAALAMLGTWLSR